MSLLARVPISHVTCVGNIHDLPFSVLSHGKNVVGEEVVAGDIAPVD